MRGRCHGRGMIRYVGWALERSGLMCPVGLNGLAFLVLGERSEDELSCGV